MQVGIPYELVGPDGTRAVFNDPDDLDFVGFLDPQGGISGLDGADVREEADVLTERDGGAHGDFYAGRMPFTLKGFIPYDGDPALASQREDRIKAACDALREDGRFRWTPIGGDTREVWFRRQQRPSIDGRGVKTFQLGLVSASHRILASSESSLQIIAGALSGVLGFGSPIKSPIGSNSQSTGSTIVTNLGSAPASPVLRIDGPIVNPTIRNATTGEEIRLVYSLAAGEWLDIDGDVPTVLLNGQVDRYRAVQFPGTRWWQLRKGANDIRLLAASFGSPAALTIAWRHAWS